MQQRLSKLESIVESLRNSSKDDADVLAEGDWTAVAVTAPTISQEQTNESTAGPSRAVAPEEAAAALLQLNSTGSHPLRSNSLVQSLDRPSELPKNLFMLQPAVTKAAVDGFFSSTGKLFQVFSTKDAEDFYYRVFDSRPVSSKKSDISCLAAIAAVGAQYLFGNFDVAVMENFYDLARYYFEYVQEERPYEAMKLCVLLAMYNILSKATVALGYIGGFS
jgi:hypothetical protein